LAETTASVSVYGDDIIVPTEMSASVMEDLESFGLRVNQNKSYNTGLFRESCGGDFYAGVCVTPVYVRKWDFTGNTRDAELITSYVSLSNQFYLKGYWHASQEVRSHLDKHFRIPITVSDVGCLTFKSVFQSTDLKYDVRTHTYCVKGPIALSKTCDDDAITERGRFILAFSRIHHQEVIYDFVESCTDRFAKPRSVYYTSGNSYVETDNNLHPECCTTRKFAPFGADNEAGIIPLGHYVYRGSRSGYKGDAPKVLTPKSFASYNRMYASVRPHALFLKHGWCPVVDIPTGIRW
jgi:hypothetical protein